MRNPVIARRYARALYKLASAQGVLPEVLAEIEEFGRWYEERAQLSLLLENPAVTVEAKTAVFERLVATELSRDFLRFLLEKNRLPLLPTIAEELARAFRQETGVVAAHATSALPLPEEIQARLVEILERVTGKKVELSTAVDADVIGGLRLRLGDHVIDATLAHRLREIRETMAGAA
ncbi:MAG: ATP synthase F1 subunit delta [Candidatus Coatesbacteria bacterium]|nr:MAG: ATP synthase F1 subunit delta [Candidatus Coatesbacteria bacterium]